METLEGLRSGESPVEDDDGSDTRSMTECSQLSDPFEVTGSHQTGDSTLESIVDKYADEPSSPADYGDTAELLGLSTASNSSGAVWETCPSPIITQPALATVLEEPAGAGLYRKGARETSLRPPPPSSHSHLRKFHKHNRNRFASNNQIMSLQPELASTERPPSSLYTDNHDGDWEDMSEAHSPPKGNTSSMSPSFASFVSTAEGHSGDNGFPPLTRFGATHTQYLEHDENEDERFDVSPLSESEKATALMSPLSDRPISPLFTTNEYNNIVPSAQETFTGHVVHRSKGSHNLTNLSSRTLASAPTTPLPALPALAAFAQRSRSGSTNFVERGPYQDDRITPIRDGGSPTITSSNKGKQSMYSLNPYHRSDEPSPGNRFPQERLLQPSSPLTTFSRSIGDASANPYTSHGLSDDQLLAREPHWQLLPKTYQPASIQAQNTLLPRPQTPVITPGHRIGGTIARPSTPGAGRIPSHRFGMGMEDIALEDFVEMNSTLEAGPVRHYGSTDAILINHNRNSTMSTFVSTPYRRSRGLTPQQSPHYTLCDYYRAIKEAGFWFVIKDTAENVVNKVFGWFRIVVTCISSMLNAIYLAGMPTPHTPAAGPQQSTTGTPVPVAGPAVVIPTGDTYTHVAHHYASYSTMPHDFTMHTIRTVTTSAPDSTASVPLTIFDGPSTYTTSIVGGPDAIRIETSSPPLLPFASGTTTGTHGLPRPWTLPEWIASVRTHGFYQGCLGMLLLDCVLISLGNSGREVMGWCRRMVVWIFVVVVLGVSVLLVVLVATKKLGRPNAADEGIVVPVGFWVVGRW